MKNFKQYLEEALRSTVDAEGNHTPGTIRKVIGALGGKRISPWNAFGSEIAKEGRVLAKAHAVQAEHDRGAPQRAKDAAMEAESSARSQREYERREGERNMTSVPIEAGGGREPKDARRWIREMMMDPNRRPIDSSRYGGRPKSPPITGWPPIDPKYTPKPGQRPSKTRGGNPNKPDKGGNHPMHEDSGERAGGPEDGNTGYGLPRRRSGNEHHMETLLKRRYEAKKDAEAAAKAAAAAEAAKSAGEQEPEHWRDFPTDVRYDQY